jgi:hypothetical protein
MIEMYWIAWLVWPQGWIPHDFISCVNIKERFVNTLTKVCSSPSNMVHYNQLGICNVHLLNPKLSNVDGEKA